jgi:hypothetical protein
MSRQRGLIVPREHGAWGILLVPLFSGAAMGLLSGAAIGMPRGGKPLPLTALTLAAVALFWLRTPLESWLGTSPMRARGREELRLVQRTLLALVAISVLALSALFWGGGNAGLWRIGAGSASAFAAQTILKKRSRIAAQIIGAAGLTATAPAAFYVATGRLDLMAWSLWLANFLFAANQIHFVQLRIYTAKLLTRAEKLAAGKAFLAGQVALAALLAIACGLRLFHWSAVIAFVPALFRGFAWFTGTPGPLEVRRLGWSELSYAATFGVLLVSLLHLG